MTVWYLLRHDFSKKAILAWILPGLIVGIVGILLGVGGVGVYEVHHYRLTYDYREAPDAVAYGNVLVVDVHNNRVAPPCAGAYADRRLVQFYPGTNRVSTVMPIRERSIDPETGDRRFKLIMGMPAPIKPGAPWVYQSEQHDNCGFFASLTAGSVGLWFEHMTHGIDMPAPDTPVHVSPDPPSVPGVAFKPPVAEVPLTGAQKDAWERASKAND